jgi:hypothetical protein
VREKVGEKGVREKVGKKGVREKGGEREGWGERRVGREKGREKGVREGGVGGCRVLKKYQGCGLLSVKPRRPSTRE